MGTTEQQEDYAFAESVRRQALRIATLIQAGKTQEAAESALVLCSQSQQRKRQITGEPEPPDVDVDHDEPRFTAGLDLGVLQREFGGNGIIEQDEP